MNREQIVRLIVNWFNGANIAQGMAELTPMLFAISFGL